MSDDAFALLGFEPQAWIDPEQLKERYVERARETHPDQQAAPSDDTDTNAEAAAINAAMKILENDVSRLALFLKQVSGEDATQDRNVPEALIELFMQLGPNLQSADRALQDLKQAQSPILQASVFAASQSVYQTLAQLNTQMESAVGEQLDRLRNAHEQWLKKGQSSSTDPLLTEFRTIYQTLSFLQRWRETITEKLFQLTPG